MEVRQNIERKITHRFYVFARGYLGQLLDSQHLSYLHSLEKFLKTIVINQGLEWSIISGNTGLTIETDHVYFKIINDLPEKMLNSPYYFTGLGNIGLLANYVDKSKLEDSLTESDVIKLFTIDPIPSVCLTIHIGHYTVTLNSSEWDKACQTQVKNGICKLLSILYTLNQAGLRIEPTKELKRLGINFWIDETFDDNFQEIEAENVIYIDLIEKNRHFQLLKIAGLTSFGIDLSNAPQKPQKRNSPTQPKPIIFPAVSTLPDFITKNMSFYLQKLRAGDIFSFLDCERYINEKFSYLQDTTEREKQFKSELIQVDFKESDLTLLFFFQLLMKELETDFALKQSFAIQEKREWMEVALILSKGVGVKSLHPLQPDQDNSWSEFANRTATSQDIGALRKKCGIPQTKDEDINQYKMQDPYQAFLKKYKLMTIENLLQQKGTSEPDRNRLNQILKAENKNWMTSLSTIFPSFPSLSKKKPRYLKSDIEEKMKEKEKEREKEQEEIIDKNKTELSEEGWDEIENSGIDLFKRLEEIQKLINETPKEKQSKEAKQINELIKEFDNKWIQKEHYRILMRITSLLQGKTTSSNGNGIFGKISDEAAKLNKAILEKAEEPFEAQKNNISLEG